MTKISGLVFYLLLSLQIFTFGQGQKIDSLENVLAKATDDSEKAFLFNEIADLYKSKDPASTKKFAEAALALSKTNGLVKEQGKAYINLGNYSIISGDYKKALEYFRLGKDLFEEYNSSGQYSKELARIYGSIGIVFSEQNNYSKSLEYNLKALKIYENLDEELTLSRIYNNIGIIYKSQHENEKALQYFYKALELQKKLNDPTIAITTTNIGNIYLARTDYKKAFEFYKTAKNLFEKNPDHRGLGELYNNIGLYYKYTRQDNDAINAWGKAIESFDQIEDKFGISDTYQLLGQFYLSKKNYTQAIEFTQKANALAKQLDLLEMQVICEMQLSEIYESSGNHTLALKHARSYNILKDSLLNYENIRQSVQSEMSFEFDKKEAIHKEKQKRQEALFAEQAKRHKLQFIFGILLLTLGLGLAFLFYNRHQLKKTLTLQKNLAEYEQKALHLQMNPHFVFNCLGSISSFILQNSNDSAIKYLTKFSKLMRLTLEYSKETLIHVDQEIESLQNYLELEQLRFNNIFNFTITKNKNIEDDLGLPPLFVQPLVENAIVHGIVPKKEPGFLSVDFSIDENHLICTITDNGIGFKNSETIKKQSVSVHKSMALEIIERRLKMIENSISRPSRLIIEDLKDDSGKIRGTKVTLLLPIQYIER